jgi:glutamate dehydrogenase
VPEDPYLGNELERYFPPTMQKRVGKFFKEHRLRREIIATATTNSMVNRMGPTFARRVQEDTGANPSTIVRAYAIAREAFVMRKTWGDIEALDNKIDASTQYEMMFETTRLLRFCTYWLIHNQAGKLHIEEQVKRLRAGLAELDDALPAVLSGADLAVFEKRRDQCRAARVPEALSKRMASFAAQRSGFDLVEISGDTRLPIDAVARVYFGVGTALSLDWIREQIESLGVEGQWQAVARTTLRDNIYNLQRVLCTQVIAESRKREPVKALDGWLERHREVVDHLRQTVNDMRALPAMDFATLSVALQAVRRMAEG